jgi:UDP-N-acetyl-D-glucosamine dehydrogenase
VVQAAVVGQGYVGLPLAVAAAQVGHQVTGIDIDRGLVELLTAGRSPICDVTDAEVQAVLDAGTYRPSTDLTCCGGADVIVLCVPTPYRDDRPDLQYVTAAAEAVGQTLRPRAVVILESTTYPGTTEEVLAPLLERSSGLRAGTDFDVVFSPERIDPGNTRFGLRDTPKVVGGLTAAGTELARQFYGSFIDHVHAVSHPKVAEMAKLLENTFRHINIALVNELAIIARDMEIDIWEVIDAAATKPFGFMPFHPGPGVGGHCIPVDPLYLSWRARKLGGAAKFIDLARDVNDAMPLYCVTRIAELLNEQERSVKGSRILVLGVTYKAGVADLRETPSRPLLAQLASRGAEVRYHDPYAPTFEIPGVGELKSVNLTEGLDWAHLVAVVTAHADIDYAEVAARGDLVFDTRNVVPHGAGVHRL